MKVHKYMSSKLISIKPKMSVKEAFITMRTHRVRHLPVVDGDQLVGFISDRDLRRPKWAESLDDWTSYYQISDETLVEDVMTRNPEVVRTSDPIRKAITKLREQRYGALPVINKKKEVVGIISAHDLLGALEDVLAKLDEK